MENTLHQLFASTLDVSTALVNEQTRREDIPSWDSLRHLILVAACEEEFGISIEPEEIAEMYTDYRRFRDIVLSKKMATLESRSTHG